MILLIVRYLDGELDEGQTRSLDSKIRRHPALAELFVLVCMHRRLMFSRVGYEIGHVHSSEDWDDEFHRAILSEVIESEKLERLRVIAESNQQDQTQARRQASSATVSGSISPILRMMFPKPVVWAGLAAVLALALLLLGPLLQNNPPATEPVTIVKPSDPDPSPSVVVARIIGADQAQWLVDSRPADLPIGSDIYNNPLTLTRGSASIRLLSGAEMTVNAPATLEPVSANRIKLSQGRVVGRCETPSSLGFTVDTPTCRVVDVGTEFGVWVDDRGDTECHVFDGLVEVVPVISGTVMREKLVSVRGGHAVAVAGDGVKRDIAMSSEEFGKPYTPLLESFEADERFTIDSYPKGFREGVLAYHDREFTWADLPAHLVGGDYLTNANHYGIDEDFSVDLNLSRPSTVWVIWHPLTEESDWLTDRFERTEYTVRLAGSKDRLATKKLYGEFRDFDYFVWRSEVPEAGLLRLGANGKRTGGGGMYTVVVTPIGAGSEPASTD